MSAARRNGLFSWPRKYGTNWFIPAFVNSRFGEVGIREADGTIVCDFPAKNSKKLFLISADVMA